MYAKLHYNVTTLSAVMHSIVSLLTGTTDKFQLTAQGIDYDRSYILTDRGPAGWRVDYYNENATQPVYIVSAPCEGSAKRKYMLLSILSTNLRCQVGYGISGSTLTTLTPVSTAAILTNDTTAHNLNAPNLELRISASARHFLLTAGTQGYPTGFGVSANTSLGSVSAVFEHTRADSYFTEDTAYVPVVTHNGRLKGSNSAATGAKDMFQSPRYRNIKLASITDVVDAAANASIFTRMSSDLGLDAATLNGTGRVWTTESSTVKALFPFGVSNDDYCFRGGSISDLCDVYLGAPGTYSEFVDIRAGASESLYSMWNVGYGGYYFAVPKG